MSQPPSQHVTVLRWVVDFHCPAHSKVNPLTVRPGTEFVEVVLDGVAYCQTPNGRKELRQGAVLWSCEGEASLHLTEPTAPYHTLALLFDTSGCPHRRPPRVSRWGDVAMLQGFARGLLLAHQDVGRDPGLTHYAYNALYWHAVSAQRTRERLPEPLQRAVSRIRQEPSRFVHVDRIAEVAGVSAPRLHALFQRHLGTTPYRFAMSERIRQARVLLEVTGLSAKEVGVTCGFESAVSFGRAFKRETGTSPLRYRQAHSDRSE